MANRKRKMVVYGAQQERAVAARWKRPEAHVALSNQMKLAWALVKAEAEAEARPISGQRQAD
jgi:hypothetical protein